jgi:putative endonuclease
VTCFVYVIGNMTPRGYRTYVGWTLDLDRRLSEHNAGTGAKSTGGRCWQLIYAEKLETRAAAMSREWYLKRDRRLRRQLSLAATVDNERQAVQP